jgi:hypothetical protein
VQASATNVSVCVHETNTCTCTTNASLYVAASGAVSATTVSIQHEINTCTKNAGASQEDTGDTPTGSHALTGALADTTSVFMPQMFAQHAAFAVLAVWPKLAVFTSSALALRTAFEAVRMRCFTTCR